MCYCGSIDFKKKKKMCERKLERQHLISKSHNLNRQRKMIKGKSRANTKMIDNFYVFCILHHMCFNTNISLCNIDAGIAYHSITFYYSILNHLSTHTHTHSRPLHFHSIQLNISMHLRTQNAIFRCFYSKVVGI